MTATPVQALVLFAVVVVVYSKGHEREVVPNATCSVCCLQSPPGVPGVNGQDGAVGHPGVPGVNGLNGRDGRDGAASLDLGELRQIVRLISKEEVNDVLSSIHAAGGILPSPSMSTCEQFGRPQPVIITKVTKTVHMPSKATSSSLLSPSLPPAPSQTPW